MPKTNKENAKFLMMLGLVFIALPLFGVFDLFFPDPTPCAACDFLDVPCQIAAAQCNLTIGAQQDFVTGIRGLLSGSLAFIGFVLFLYGAYKYVR